MPSAWQVVVLAAGMDAPAYRLPWPPATTVFEVDQPAVITGTAELLAGEPGLSARDDRGRSGRRPGRRTLFARIDELSAPGSVLLYDVVAGLLQAMTEQAHRGFSVVTHPVSWSSRWAGRPS